MSLTSLQVQTDSADQSKRHVLLVEDYPANILVATTMLELLGHTCEVANNGEEALARLKTQRFDCVFMDIKMPGIDGLNATKLLRKWELENARPPLPIIGMTAYALVGDKERCIDAGMSAYISKPFKQQDIANALAQF